MALADTELDDLGYSEDELERKKNAAIPPPPPVRARGGAEVPLSVPITGAPSGDVPPVTPPGPAGVPSAITGPPPVRPPAAAPGFAERYATLQSQKPDPNDPRYAVPSWKKGLGAALGTVAGMFSPGADPAAIYRGVARGPYNRAEQQWEQKGAGLTEEAKLADTEAQMRQRDEAAELAKSKANQPAKRQYENMNQLHADAVQEAIAKGVDPAKDVKVQQIEASLLRLAKPSGTYNVAEELHKEHPEWQPEQIQEALEKPGAPVAGEIGNNQAFAVFDPRKGWVDTSPARNPVAGFKPSPSKFPRVFPVNDAQGNITGYNVLIGDTMQYRPVSAFPGAPASVIPPKPTSTTLTMSQMAKTIEPQMQRFQKEIDDVASQMGPAVGRWNDLMVGKIGTDNPKFAGFLSDTDAMAVAIVRTHLGASGGEQYIADIKNSLRASQSPDDLKARLDAWNQWIAGYAGMTGGGTTPTKPPASTTPTKPAEKGKIQFTPLPNG